MTAHHSQPERSDPFDEVLRALEQWDRECRRAHAGHMAELAELREALELNEEWKR